MTIMSQFNTTTREHLPVQLDRFPDSCDPDFDYGAEELERQFAELRLTFDNE